MSYRKEENSSASMTKEIPFQLTFRDIEPTDSVRFAVQTHIEKLESHNLDIISCSIVVSRPHRHHHRQAAYHVEVRAHIPGEYFVVNRDTEKDNTHDVFVVLSEAFGALDRTLASFIDKRSGFTKKHESTVLPNS